MSVTVLSAPVNAVETLMANTNNAETRLIEEGALLPEYLRFESEPRPLSTWLVKLFENCGRRLENKASTKAKTTWFILTK